MGSAIQNQKPDRVQVLLIGPPDSGKTTLLYKNLLQKENFKKPATTTMGFQFEEVHTQGDEEHEGSTNSAKIGVWDIAGSPTS